MRGEDCFPAACVQGSGFPAFYLIQEGSPFDYPEPEEDPVTDRKDIEELVRRLADGEVIDWKREEDRLHTGDSLLSALRFIEGVADLHDPATASWTVPITDSVLPLEPGSLFAGRYRVQAELGRGGFGIVYRAFDEGPLQRTVALKIVSTAGASDDDSLFREARIAARVNHPGIATVHDAGVSEERAFMVQELVPGSDLTTLIAQEGRLSLPRFSEIAGQLAEALGAAHEAGIVHRDIKCRNVVVDPQGRCKITDFGIAHAAGVGGLKGELIPGTPGFAAPEQLRGLATDGRVDIFALGCVLYQMLCGVLPFPGRHPAEVIRKTLYDKPEPPISIRPEIPIRLSAVILKCLHRDPDSRYQTCHDLLLDLEAATRPRSRLRQSPKRIAIASALGLALVSMLVVGLRYSHLSHLTFAKGVVTSNIEGDRAHDLGIIRLFAGTPEPTPVDRWLGFPRFLRESHWDVRQFPDSQHVALAKGIYVESERDLSLLAKPWEKLKVQFIREPTIQGAEALLEQLSTHPRLAMARTFGICNFVAYGASLDSTLLDQLLETELREGGNHFSDGVPAMSSVVAATLRQLPGRELTQVIDSLLGPYMDRAAFVRALGFIESDALVDTLKSLANTSNIGAHAKLALLDLGRCDSSILAEARSYLSRIEPQDVPVSGIGGGGFSSYASRADGDFETSLWTLAQCGTCSDVSVLEQVASRFLDSPALPAIVRAAFLMCPEGANHALSQVLDARPLAWIPSLLQAKELTEAQSQRISTRLEQWSSSQSPYIGTFPSTLGKRGLMEGPRYAYNVMQELAPEHLTFALDALFWCRSPRVRDALLNFSRRPHLRRSEQVTLAYALRHYADADACSALLDLMTSSDSFVKGIAWESHSRLANRAHECRQSVLPRDSEFNILQAFHGEYRDDHTVEVVSRFLERAAQCKPEDQFLLSIAVQTLRDICLERPYSYARELLDSPYRLVRLAAAAALVDVQAFPDIGDVSQWTSGTSSLDQARVVWCRRVVGSGLRDLQSLARRLKERRIENTTRLLGAMGLGYGYGRSGFSGAVASSFSSDFLGGLGGVGTLLDWTVVPLYLESELLQMSAFAAGGNPEQALELFETSRNPARLMKACLEDPELASLTQTYGFQVLAGLREPMDPWAGLEDNGDRSLEGDR